MLKDCEIGERVNQDREVTCQGPVSRRSLYFMGPYGCSVFIPDGSFKSFENYTNKTIS